MFRAAPSTARLPGAEFVNGFSDPFRALLNVFLTLRRKIAL